MPSLTLDTTDYERYAFDYFRRTTARQMHLNTPRAWMTRLVLRLSHEIPVFRAIAALGGIHRGLVQITHVGFVHTFLEDRNTLHQYGKAIVALEPHIGELYSRFTPVLETVLCACILLAACEIVKSDTTAAISHLRFGNRVFLDYDPTKQTGMLYETETSKTLISTFKLLQANGILLETRSAESCSSIPSSPMSSPPPSDLETLRVTLERLTTEERDLRTDLLRMAQADASQDLTGKNILEKWCIDHCKSRTIKPNLNDNLSSRLQKLITRHASWMISFKSTLDSLSIPPGDKKTKRSLILLQIQHFYSTFLLTSCRSVREVPNDVFHDEYCRILDLADEYLDSSRLADGDLRQSSSTPANFAVEPVILPALYLIALKCRDSIVRRRAIQTLASTDRLEGFQKSRSLAAFASKIVEIEERRARAFVGLHPTYDQPLRAEQVPEAARFLDVTVKLAPRKPLDFEIVGGRFAFEREGELEVVRLTGETDV